VTSRRTGVVRYLLDQAFNAFRPGEAQVKIRRDAMEWLEIFRNFPGFYLEGEEYRRPHYWTIWRWTRTSPSGRATVPAADLCPPATAGPRPPIPPPQATAERSCTGWTSTCGHASPNVDHVPAARTFHYAVVPTARRPRWTTQPRTSPRQPALTGSFARPYKVVVHETSASTPSSPIFKASESLSPNTISAYRNDLLQFADYPAR